MKDNNFIDEIYNGEEVDETDTSENKEKKSRLNRTMIKKVTILALAMVMTSSAGIGAIRSSQPAQTSVKTEAKQKVEYNAIKIDNSRWHDIKGIVENGYFDAISKQADLKILNAFCVNDSSLYKKYDELQSKSKYMYDTEYSEARGLKYLGKSISGVSLKSLRKEGDTYKAKISLKFMNEADTSEFFYANSYMICKHFKGTEVTEQNLTRFMLQVMDAMEPVVSDTTIELELKDMGDSFAIVDDSEITKLFESSYSSCIKNMAKEIGLHS